MPLRFGARGSAGSAANRLSPDATASTATALGGRPGGLACRAVAIAGALLVLYAAALFMTGDALRDTDQASYVHGALQLAALDAPLSGPDFHNYDKQYGSCWVLALAFALSRGAPPVLIGNLLQIVVVGIALCFLGRRLARNRATPLRLLLPIYLSPTLVLALPFFGTNALSLAFLLIGFSLLKRGDGPADNLAACALVAVAAACRGDVVLAIPALLLAHRPRCPLRALLMARLTRRLFAAALLPPLLGAAITGGGTPETAPFLFEAKLVAGFLVFGLGLPALVLLGAQVAAYLRLAVTRRRWFLFYAGIAGALVLPFVFYLPQLHTPRYLFLSLAATMFVVLSRRTAPLYAALRAKVLMRAAETGTIALACLPWLVGIQLPTLSHPRLVFADATEFPSSKGHQPMGALLAYIYQARQNSLVLDHNQAIWLAAQSVAYRGCSEGVPILDTPMSNFLILAAYIQGGKPFALRRISASPCGFAYADARTLTRTSRDDVVITGQDIFDRVMHIVSRDDVYGQPILAIDKSRRPSDTAALLAALRRHFGGREIAFHAYRQATPERDLQIAAQTPFDYAVFAVPGTACTVAAIPPVPPHEGPADPLLAYQFSGTQPAARVSIAFHCTAPAVVGWAQTTLPPYMSRERQGIFVGEGGRGLGSGFFLADIGGK